MAPKDMKKTTLITKTGLYGWTVMPFGLKNATSTFTRTMSTVFKELGDKFLKIFVDDLNVHNENWEGHLQHLDVVFRKLREMNLKLNRSKCCFVMRSVTFLGHVVSEEGTKPDLGKVDAVVHFPIPKTVTNIRFFLGLTGYYRNYVRGYSRLAAPLFELTKKDVAFVWNSDCHQAFEALKRALVATPVLVRPDFRKPFCLDVDWSLKGVGAILSQREGRLERVVAYASKGLTSAQRKFHPMEGECYALIWGIMHFRQYLHRNHFTLRTDHKPLEWLAIVSDADGRTGRWIDMLQDFSFKILHRPGLKHMNVNALSRNLVGQTTDDDDFSEEIQDIGAMQDDSMDTTGRILSVQYGKESDWFGYRRHSKGLTEHHKCYFGINHWRWLEDHQLFMLDVVTEITHNEEANSLMEDVEAAENEEGQSLGTADGRQSLKKEMTKYYDRQQQLELVLAAQELSEFGEHGLGQTRSGEEETYEMDTRSIDIWKDATCLGLLKGGVLPDTIDLEESKRARKRITNYCWKEERLYFKGLYVFKLEERMRLVSQMHEDLGHFGEQRTLAEICRRYFWHSRTEDVRTVVKMCQHCQLVRSTGSIRSEDENMKSIPICELFYRIALDTVGPLPETKSGNKYILVAVDHYSKWCEAKAVADHGAKTTMKFLEHDVICRYGVPKFVLTDNGGEWAAEFDIMCRDYGIQHQRTTPQWPQCNGMAEHLIKTIKHGITILAATPENVDCWGEHLAKVMFEYRCGI
jgi:hypothetical protein